MGCTGKNAFRHLNDRGYVACVKIVRQEPETLHFDKQMARHLDVKAAKERLCSE
jgi:hypothetical protein